MEGIKETVLVGRCLTCTCKVSVEWVWEVVGLLPDHTDTINLSPCHGNWCWWMDLDCTDKAQACTLTYRKPAHVWQHVEGQQTSVVLQICVTSIPLSPRSCFSSTLLTISTILVSLFHPWIVRYSIKGSFAERYIRAKLLIATQKPCKWAVREAHQSSCQMRSPIIIYGHNWPVFPQAMTPHWWIWWWLCSAQQSGSSQREERKFACAEGMHARGQQEGCVHMMKNAF